MIALIAVSGDAAEVEAARLALAETTRGLAFFEGANVESWVDRSGTAGAAWVRSAGPQVVAESAVAERGLAAFVLGRPIRWVDEQAEGLSVLDAQRMAALDPDELADGLDGRGLLVRVDGEGITVVGDPMGSYPLWSWERGSEAGAAGTGGIVGRAGRRTTKDGSPALWVTNLPGALRRSGSPEDVLDRGRIAGAIAYGSSFDGAPWWKGTRRITGWFGGGLRHPRLRVHSAAPSMRALARMHRRRGEIDAAGAGRMLVEITSAMARRAGEDVVVPASGGRDSRLIMAAALAANLPFRAVTGGSADSEDFVVGRALSHAAGVQHLSIAGAQATRSTHPLDTIAMVSALSCGVVTAADAHFFPHAPSTLASTWLSGQGGEIARAFYGRAFSLGTAPVVVLRTLSRRPGRSLPLSVRAEGLFATSVLARLQRITLSGASGDALGDLYYLSDRMARHLGGALIHFELGLDYAAPLWSRRLLPLMWAGSPKQHQRSTFHDEVTRALVAGQPAATRDAFASELHQGAPKDEAIEPGGKVEWALAVAQDHVAARAKLLDQKDPLWSTLHRGRTLALACRDPDDLDFIERQHVWRLATALQAWTDQAAT